jgi:hypothetical protein
VTSSSPSRTASGRTAGGSRRRCPLRSTRY